MKIGILGCGNWGSVFGIIQAKKGHSIKIWEFDKERARFVQETRNNEPFLNSNYKIPKEILIDHRLENILRDSEIVVFAIPCQKLGSVLKEIKKTKIKNAMYLSLIKGIEINTLLLPSMLIKGELKIDPYVLSGPSIANEIIRNEPTAVVIAGKDRGKARFLQKELSTRNLRIYLTDDIIGVEVGGAVKNVLAIACGISDGLGFGTNAKGALITRGIVEIQRLGVAMGANAKTFYGLSGLGDLITTSFSEESRNHKLGKLLGKGEEIDSILKKIVMIAEGLYTSKAVARLASRFNIEMPICKVVYEIIYKKKSPRQGIEDLMQRPLKEEG